MTNHELEDEDDTPPGTGSGRGGPTGAPGQLGDLAPPSSDQEANEVVSGGGLVGPDDDEGPRDDAEESR